MNEKGGSSALFALPSHLPAKLEVDQLPATNPRRRIHQKPSRNLLLHISKKLKGGYEKSWALIDAQEGPGEFESVANRPMLCDRKAIGYG